jgi:lipoprotein signal peptidase
MRQVVDFIEVGVKKFKWPVFNFADSFVTIGIILIIWVWLFGRKKTESDSISLTKTDNMV